MRKVRPISRIQPLQIDTAKLLPNSAIPGIVPTPVNVVGSGLAAKTTLSRNVNVQMPDGHYRLVVVVAGATGTGSYKIHDLTRGTVTGTILTSATKTAGLISGVDVLIADTTGTTAGNYVEFDVIGDQTYIIPGVIIGRIKTGVNAGVWKPITDAEIANCDAFGITQSFQETDKNKTVLPHGYENNISDVYTIDYIVYGQLIESVCREINLTDALKGKLTHIHWV